VPENSGPNKVKLEKGKDYYWCSCGKSADKTFCNGSHKGSSHAPKAFHADKDGDAYLCRCKQTGKPPYCDGSHKK
jgi:CDGSH-type Zn-finger protein